MEKVNLELSSIFKTKEQEKLFARCARKAMHKTVNGEFGNLSHYESTSTGMVRVTPVFQTNEQEELFARCAEEAMFKYMNDEALHEKEMQRILGR